MVPDFIVKRDFSLSEEEDYKKNVEAKVDFKTQRVFKTRGSYPGCVFRDKSAVIGWEVFNINPPGIGRSPVPVGLGSIIHSISRSVFSK